MLGLAGAAIAAAAYVQGARDAGKGPGGGDPPLPNARQATVTEFQGRTGGYAQPANQTMAARMHDQARRRDFDWRLLGPVDTQGGQRKDLVSNNELHQRNLYPRNQVGVRRDGENSGVAFRRAIGPEAAAKLRNMLADVWSKDPPFFGTGNGTDRVYRFEANRLPRIDPGTLIDRRAKHWNSHPNVFTG